MSACRRILVPFDFTGPSKRAADYAIELATALGAHVCLLNVLEGFHFTLTSEEHAGLVTGAMQELERAAARVRPHLANIETRAVEGTPWDQIEATARADGTDLIVMGTHGRRGLARALLGSVSSRALQTSTFPVTIVREYVAVSRNAAGGRLATALERPSLENPHVLALSRGALTVATALAEKLDASIGLWDVEPVLADDGAVLGAIGEDGAVAFDDHRAGKAAERERAVAAARRRLHQELTALGNPHPIGDCSKMDIVLVADGVFSAAYARVAIEAIRQRHPRTVILATPIIARDLLPELEGVADAVITLEHAILTDTCVYRDDALPSDLVASELILAPHVAGAIA